jgi:hypothetical protein
MDCRGDLAHVVDPAPGIAESQAEQPSRAGAWIPCSASWRFTGQLAPGRGRCEQAQAAGARNGLGPVVRAELGVEVADVGSDGVR